MFAVIKTGGKQYRVRADDLLKVERLVGEPGQIIQFDDILAVGEGANVEFGAPLIEGASVAAEILGQGKGLKVIAFKKRRRQNSRRKRGHRQELTTVRIREILTDGAQPSKALSEKTSVKEESGLENGKAETTQSPLFIAPQGGGKDDLTKITGIGPVAAGQLNEQGLVRFTQLAGMTDEEMARVDAIMPFSAQQIAGWRSQAKTLVQQGGEEDPAAGATDP